MSPAVPRGPRADPPTPADADASPEAAAPTLGSPGEAPVPVFLTAIEAAQLLRLTADTVRRQASAGLLPGVRLGRH